MAFNQNNYYHAPLVESTSALPFESLHQLRLEQWRRQQQLMQHSVMLNPTTAAAHDYYCNYNPYYDQSGTNDTAAPLLYPDLYGVQESYRSYVKKQQQQQLMEQLMERLSSLFEVDRKCPFLTPWSPDFVAPRHSKPSGEPGSDEYMKFQPGSIEVREDQVKQVQQGPADESSHETDDQVKHEKQGPADESSYETDHDFLHQDDQADDYSLSVDQDPTEDIFYLDDLYSTRS